MSSGYAILLKVVPSPLPVSILSSLFQRMGRNQKKSMCSQLLSCVWLFVTPMDYSSPPSPGCSVHGIFQARISEWDVISFSRGSFWPRDWIHVFYISCTGRQILYHCVTCVAHIRGKTPISFNKANITLYLIREMQIKMTMRYHYAATKKAKIQNIGNTKYWWGCRETVTLFIARGMHNGIATLEDRQFSYKSKETRTTEQLSSLVFIQWN